MSIPAEVEKRFRSLGQAARSLRGLSRNKKDLALNTLADAIAHQASKILNANSEDVARLVPETTPAFRDRLTLNEMRLDQIGESLRQVARLDDPVGEVVDERLLANGLDVKRVRAPLGVIFMIFESRPNVIVEAFSLAFKSGNAIALRGGSDSRSTAHAFYDLIHSSLTQAGVDPDSAYGIEDYDRELVASLLKRKDWIDVAVPRGGEKLIDMVTRTALMPVIKNDRGLCHAFVDRDADLAMAVNVVANAKTQRPGVCNALETVLVHKEIASDFLPKLFHATDSAGLKWKCDSESLAILKNQRRVEAASSQDWDTEHLDQILNCKIIASLDEALDHIAKHGSRHSEAILTRSLENARRFQNEVDAAAVYWNASTRFTDGFELGLGGELGVSTQKLHVRGPVGLRELTTPRWIIEGQGQVRT